MAEHVAAGDAYVADPSSADPLVLNAQGLDLADRYTELSADADAEDLAALTECADELTDAALDLADAVGG